MQIKIALSALIYAFCIVAVCSGASNIKRNEMLDTSVMVQTPTCYGSGTIIDCLETDTKGIQKYIVITNKHVIDGRLITQVNGVDGLRNSFRMITIDRGCRILVFGCNEEWTTIDANIIDEDESLDVALLSFESDQVLPIARMADQSLLEQIRVFDEIFAIGCQLGNKPLPTNGIVSQIIKQDDLLLYSITSCIAPGSSGGGVFIRHDNHYYFIGIPFKTDVAYNGQFIPHLGYAISLSSIQSFIDNNSVSAIDE